MNAKNKGQWNRMEGTSITRIKNRRTSNVPGKRARTKPLNWDSKEIYFKNNSDVAVNIHKEVKLKAVSIEKFEVMHNIIVQQESNEIDNAIFTLQLLSAQIENR